MLCPYLGESSIGGLTVLPYPLFTRLIPILPLTARPAPLDYTPAGTTSTIEMTVLI